MQRGSGGLRYDGKIAGLYDLEETLGSGHFAIVKSARHVFTGEKVAVKVIDKSKLDEVSRAHLFQEVRCMKLVQHPNVVRLYEVIDTQTKLYLILELADGGDLYDYIMRHETGLAEDTAREYFRQIVRAISYCHRLHVVHRDLKPENVVFFETLGIVKLTDFGFSNRFNPGQKLETSCGSLAYSAPEILLGDSYDAPAVDVWSLGVILYMLVCGQAPFQEANDSETLTMIMDVKYTTPRHVSEGCKRLIGRMLVREPERRASLAQITADRWLGGDNVSVPADFLPLVSREHVSEENHALILQKMINGNIATKEEILEALDRNEYNHITATYFLLAERKLRAHRQEQASNQRKLRAETPPTKPAVTVDVALEAATADVDQSLLGTRQADAHRVRKCSIVQEEEDEDDVAVPGRDEVLPPHCSLNRRGSRSEGKLSLVLQERLAESERRKEAAPAHPVAGFTRVGVRDDSSRPESPWLHGGKRNLPPSSDKVTSLGTGLQWRGDKKTSVLVEAATVPGGGKGAGQGAGPWYKTVPSPTRGGQVALNEIFEEGGQDEGQVRACPGPARAPPSRPPAYEQRRAKFHKARTASCSSSDASDDDSESRKKRAHKLSAEGKPLVPRRDSHDDSSDSQDPSGGGAGGGGGGGTRGTECSEAGTAKPPAVTDNSRTSGGTSGGTESRQCSAGRRQRAGRRRAGETRLRESQSLNRITEVQEAEHVAPPPLTPPLAPPPKTTRGFGARLLHGWTLGTGKKGVGLTDDHHNGGNVKVPDGDGAPRNKRDPDEKENCKTSAKPDKKPGKKVRLLGRYFAMHKKLCLPLPGIFGRGRLYKAQSCSSILRERVTVPATTVARDDGWRTERVARKADVNRNAIAPRLDAIVPLVADCPGIKICDVHSGGGAECCRRC